MISYRKKNQQQKGELMDKVREFELAMLEPLTELLCGMRLKLNGGDSYAGIGSMSLNDGGTVTVRFEWVLRLVTDSEGDDGFKQGDAIPVRKSLLKNGYTMNLVPIGLELSDRGWQKIEVDEGCLLLSFDEGQIKMIVNLYVQLV